MGINVIMHIINGWLIVTDIFAIIRKVMNLICINSLNIHMKFLLGNSVISVYVFLSSLTTFKVKSGLVYCLTVAVPILKIG